MRSGGRKRGEVKELTYATVCSGVECMSVAAMGLPMKPVFFSEIEPFPCAVLKHHFPTVPNLGDMSKIEIKDIDENIKEITNGRTTVTIRGGLDIFAGGTPCQDVSVAGKRRGMEEGSGTRSSLAFEFVRLIRGLQPRYVIWENVAGVLSDESFPKFLVSLAECGYRVAYRTFDAQYVTCADIDGEDAGMDGDGGIELSRAVPQRRRRVWVLCSRIVGCAGADVADPCAVLFESAGLLGDHPPCRKSREEIAALVGGRTGVHGEVVERTDYDGRPVASTLTKSNAGGWQRMPDKDNFNAVVERRVTNEVAQTFVKVAHASGESAKPLNCAATDKDHTGGVIATNSNGGDVMPSVTANEAKLGGDNQHNNGGGVCPRVCEANRDRARELAKITRKALAIVRGRSRR